MINGNINVHVTKKKKKGIQIIPQVYLFALENTV